jgi:acyl carrier protein
MENGNVTEKIVQIFDDIFNIENIKIDNNSSQDDIKDWDSIGHVRLMMALEKEFNINIPIEDAIELLIFNDIKDYISKKT